MTSSASHREDRVTQSSLLDRLQTGRDDGQVAARTFKHPMQAQLLASGLSADQFSEQRLLDHYDRSTGELRSEILLLAGHSTITRRSEAVSTSSLLSNFLILEKGRRYPQLWSRAVHLLKEALVCGILAGAGLHELGEDPPDPVHLPPEKNLG